jgi:DNA-binding winged helix-turn-helix (wHTH) protein
MKVKGGGVMTFNASPTLEPQMADGSAKGLALTSRYIRFGPFQIDQHRQEVSKNGVRLRLQGKVYQVLLALIEKQGEVVTREELRMRLWPADTHVNYDANVNTTVNKLRQALGDSSETPAYVETIPRKGYSLMVEAEYADAPLQPSPTANAASPNGKTQQKLNAAADGQKSEIWITIGVIGLILAGMLLGAGITRLWLYHLAAPSSNGFPF